MEIQCSDTQRRGIPNGYSSSNRLEQFEALARSSQSRSENDNGEVCICAKSITLMVKLDVDHSANPTRRVRLLPPSLCTRMSLAPKQQVCRPHCQQRSSGAGPCSCSLLGRNSRLRLASPALPCPALLRPAPSCPALPCPALPCPTPDGFNREPLAENTLECIRLLT